MGDIKTIGVLTSGGDCSGLNVAIRSIVIRARMSNIKVYGIHEGTVGLLKRPLDVEELTAENVDVSFMRKGGTFLKTVNKGDPFNYPMEDGTYKDMSMEIVDGYKQLGIDALIAIGGDGSMKIIEKLTTLGNIRFIGIPKTIDNDVPFTTFPIGHITAVNVIVDAIDRLHDTAFSHNRIMVVEVMGRDVGHLALASGVAGGADIILIPEIPYDINVIANKIKDIYNTSSRSYAIVVCSEAAVDIHGNNIVTHNQYGKHFGGVGDVISKQIADLTNYETRVTVLGHIQRGGSPSSLDRMISSAFGVRAVELLLEGKSGRILALQNNSIVDYSIAKVNSAYGGIDIKNNYLINTARGMGISFGI